jgi:hypothetical protein
VPLIEKGEKHVAVDYGYSFGSKKVNMGPAFLNLRVMCECLARALSKHMEFSKGIYLFLEDLEKAEDDNKFSYHFKKDLKLGGGNKNEFEELERKMKM